MLFDKFACLNRVVFKRLLILHWSRDKSFVLLRKCDSKTSFKVNIYYMYLMTT